VLDIIFRVLLVLGQAPAATALWLTSLPMRAGDIVGPAVRALLWLDAPSQTTGRRTDERRGNVESDVD
jgi:hypothetical protein